MPVYTFAESMSVSINPDTYGSWEVLYNEKNEKEMLVWRMIIHSPDAESLSFGFSKYHMPKGGRLFIYTSDGENKIRAFTNEDNDDHGQLWMPILEHDKVVIEVNIPPDKVDELKLELDKINHGFRPINKATADDSQNVSKGFSGSCNVDTVCPSSDGWRDQIRSVAVYSLNGTIMCTGAAINAITDRSDAMPYFLTASHCDITSSNAASFVVYWNYENSICRPQGESGSDGDGELTQFNTGAIMRADYSPTDVTLVELDDPIEKSANVYLSGWDRTFDVPDSAVAIHHPNGAEKRISFENDPLSFTSVFEDIEDTNGTHLRVADWDLGTTEPGSSGSPLFNSDRRIIGQLSGGLHLAEMIILIGMVDYQCHGKGGGQ